MAVCEPKASARQSAGWDEAAAEGKPKEAKRRREKTIGHRSGDKGQTGHEKREREGEITWVVAAHTSERARRATITTSQLKGQATKEEPKGAWERCGHLTRRMEGRGH
ncbi:uncharacterized protein UDID_18491 [Ustilago sp. UG-2017a]|nr:uncharacterized protein UDID_18491 [Ustilago sp. UG-2017a]